jgi:hypothetical protein
MEAGSLGPLAGERHVDVVSCSHQQKAVFNLLQGSLAPRDPCHWIRQVREVIGWYSCSKKDLTAPGEVFARRDSQWEFPTQTARGAGGAMHEILGTTRYFDSEIWVMQISS